jgi:hypothetical protein
MSWRDFFSSLSQKLDPVQSYFLPAVPTRKFPPQLPFRLPKDAISMFALSSFEAMFPFEFGDTTGDPKDKASFNLAIDEMLKDREYVFKRTITVIPSKDEKNKKEFRTEYRFSQHLLRRNQVILDRVSTSVATQYNFLLDLMGQLLTHRDDLSIQVDELGAYWVRLRKAKPYRERSFFSDVTALVHTPGPGSVNIVFGETDSDIDVEYQYGWMSSFIRSIIDRAVTREES